MDLTIRLLGMPSIERGGQPLRPPRGRKAWAVLAYLLLTDRQVSRQHLAELLLPLHVPVHVETVQPVRTKEREDMLAIRHRRI